MERDQKNLEEIIKRLNILIALNLENTAQKGLSMTDKIIKLSNLGVSSADIARILGKPANYITATLSQKKRKKKKKGRSDDE
jgi:regulatory protein YycI of two-component signal transduction system YycFG